MPGLSPSFSVRPSGFPRPARVRAVGTSRLGLWIVWAALSACQSPEEEAEPSAECTTDDQCSQGRECEARTRTCVPVAEPEPGAEVVTDAGGLGPEVVPKPVGSLPPLVIKDGDQPSADAGPLPEPEGMAPEPEPETQPGDDGGAADPEPAGDAGTEDGVRDSGVNSGVGLDTDGAAPASEDDASAPGSVGCNSGGFSEPQRVTGLDLSGTPWGPAFSPDGLTLYLSAANFGAERLYRAERQGRGNQFAAATELSELNTESQQGRPFVSADGHSLYFFRVNRDSRNLWVATRDQEDEPWGNLLELQGVNSDDNDYLPWLSPDELTMYFTSSRSGGSGDTDVWVARRPSRSAAFDLVEAEVAINSGDSDASPALSPDQLTIYFTTDRQDDGGDAQVWSASRSSLSEPFVNPEPVEELSSNGDDTNVALSFDGTELILSSDRSGDRELWLARRECER